MPRYNPHKAYRTTPKRNYFAHTGGPCEDYPCCGHEDGCCPTRTSSEPAPKQLSTSSGVPVLTENQEKDGFELKFPGKPSDAILALFHETSALPSAQRWHWHFKLKFWYAKRNDATREFAQLIISQSSGLGTPVVPPAAAQPETPAEREEREFNSQAVKALLSGRSGVFPPRPAPAPKSWKTEVCVSGDWSSNGCRYATQAEAVEAGKELLSRWFVPTDSRAVASDDPINYRFNFEAYKSEMLPEPVVVAPVPPVQPAPRFAGGGDPVPLNAEHESFPKADWAYEVQNGDTRLGYEEWVEAKMDLAAEQAVELPVENIVPVAFTPAPLRVDPQPQTPAPEPAAEVPDWRARFSWGENQRLRERGKLPGQRRGY